MTTSASASPPPFTLSPEDVTEFLADIEPGDDIRVDSVLGQAAANGEQRVSAGKWHLQIDHAGENTFTITIHGRRTWDRDNRPPRDGRA